jgi:hypothetical protein
MQGWMMTFKYGGRFCLSLFTNDPDIAVQAEQAGIDRIGTDLESLGKQARQGGLNTWISDHTLADLTAIAARIDKKRLFCRINPIHQNSKAEIDALLDIGVSTIMLPMFTTTSEVEAFLRLLDGRAHPVLLLETAAAANIVGDICRVPGVREIHVGFNDLRLSLGWPSHFHVLVSDLLVGLSDTINTAGIAFRMGGLGRADDETLQIPSSLTYPQFPRLHATGALISRVFFNIEPLDMVTEIRKLRARLDSFADESREALELHRLALQKKLT